MLHEKLIDKSEAGGVSALGCFFSNKAQVLGQVPRILMSSKWKGMCSTPSQERKLSVQPGDDLYIIFLLFWRYDTMPYEEVE